MTIFLAIFETEGGDKFIVEYQPRYSEKDGCVLIEIQSVTHTKRPASWTEQRAEYQRTPTPRTPRQLELTEWMKS